MRIYDPGVDVSRLIGSNKEAVQAELQALLAVQDVDRDAVRGKMEEINEIASILADVVQAQEEGQSTWRGWLKRLGNFYDQRFGAKWMDDEKEFWEQIKYRI